MGNNILNPIKNVDLTHQWVELSRENNNPKIITSEKTNWSLFKWGFVYVITFGYYDHEKECLKEIALHIKEIYENTLREMPSEEKISTLQAVEVTVAKLSVVESSISNLFETVHGNVQKSINEMSAVSLYRADGGDFRSVFSLCTDDKTKKSFILATDANGETFFHDFFSMKQNIQKNQIENLRSALGDELFKECLLKQNSKGKTPLDIAISNGQMGVISLVFPIPKGDNDLIFNAEEKKQILSGVRVFYETYTDPSKRLDHLKNCPGPNIYDKENHILSAIHHVSFHNPSHLKNDRPIKDFELLPLSFRWILEPLTPKTSSSIEKIIKQCKDLTNAEDIASQMSFFGYETADLEPSNKSIGITKALSADKKNPLLGLIKGSLTGSLEDRNSYKNALNFILNPYAAYDQKIDFTEERFQHILFDVVDLSISGNADIKKDILPIIEMLILKYPDFLTKKLEGKDIFTYLKSFDDQTSIKIMKTKLKELNNHNAFIEIQTIKSLKYYLEERGRSLMS